MAMINRSCFVGSARCRSVYLGLLPLVPLAAILALSSLWRGVEGGGTRGTRVAVGTPALSPPPMVRQHLERALSDGKGSEVSIWDGGECYGGIGEARGGHVWVGESSGSSGKSVMAVCDETTGELILFTRIGPQGASSPSDTDSVRPLLGADAAKRAARTYLCLLCKTNPSDWRLSVHKTVTPPVTKDKDREKPPVLWVVRGTNMAGKHDFQMRIDAASGELVFYTEKKDHGLMFTVPVPRGEPTDHGG